MSFYALSFPVCQSLIIMKEVLGSSMTPPFLRSFLDSPICRKISYSSVSFILIL